MRKNHSFFGLIMLMVFFTGTTFGQTGNFDETWKEFLENDKISNMSALIKPNPNYQLPQYAKYLLMNTNTNFCQTKIGNAEELMTEVQAIDATLLKSIPGFLGKMEELDTKITAYHRVDEIWKEFLRSKTVPLKALEDIEYGSAVCEKSTLAKYSYMTAYYHLCQGDIARSMDIFENRTLRLTEKTTLRVNDVQGLAGEVAKMKELYRGMARLEEAWRSYVNTGVSPGFQEELPVFDCYPMPTIKILILNGALDICNAAPEALAEVKQIQAESGLTPERDVARKIKDLEAAVGSNDANMAALNTAWEAFIPDNKVKHMGQYGYEYCTQEALIRAYIMDGFAYVCEMSQMMLEKIDAIQQAEMIPLEEITMIKINELAALSDQYEIDGRKIENLWDKFVRQGDLLYEDYESADIYCDNIHQVKDWTMKGLMGSCEDGIAYLEQIESFQRTFEFNFTKDVECRVRKLRIKVWECREEALTKLARIEAPDNYEARLEELMQEYGVGERPEACEQ